MEKELSVYFRNDLVLLEVVLPVNHVGEFMVRFGERFSVEDMGFGTVIRKVTNYYYGRNGWHVELTVEKKLEKELDDFLREFASEHGLNFADSDNDG